MGRLSLRLQVYRLPWAGFGRCLLGGWAVPKGLTFAEVAPPFRTPAGWVGRLGDGELF
jgi:hypothetical protein